MSTSSERLTASIMGRDYQLSCAVDEKSTLLQAIKMVDDRMREVQANGKVKSADRIAVMVCLNLAVELLSANSAPDAQLGDLRSTIERINALADEALIDVALETPQDKLF